MASYDVTTGRNQHDDGVETLAGAWVLCVIRFKAINTYDRATKRSTDLDGSTVAAERGEPLIITDDCLSVTTSATKGSHVKNLQAFLLGGNLNYISEINPGDWIMCWMVQDEEKARDLVDRIRRKQPCNNFDDGLKFLGRVYSIRRRLGVNPNNGQKTVRYALQGNGFSEFDSSFFYDPYLSVAEPFINTWLGKMSLAVNDFLSQDGIDVNKAMPSLVELLFGKGISKSVANPTGDPELQAGTGLTEGEGTAPFAYVVPESVGSLLGRQSRSSGAGVLAYADLLERMFGVQKYDSGAEVAPQPLSPYALFQPSAFRPMLGKFLPSIPSFNGRSVWSTLSQYLNPVVNEMYTCLRANAEGKIVPTLVVRQLPFTSERLVNDKRTGFLELPRWKVPDRIVLDEDVGKCDALRFNFIHLTGMAQAQAQNNIITFQLVREGGQPIRDDQDIRRSGLRADIQTVACGIEDQQLGPREWMDLRADILMGQHLTLTGSLDCFGIQAPICEGDNLEWDGTVYHIESVVHSCSIGEDGKKRFMTSLQLSHGIRANEQTAPAGYDANTRMYQAIGPDDLTTYEPGRTVERQDETETESETRFGDNTIISDGVA